MRTFLSVLFVHFALLILGLIFSGKNPQKDLPQKISVQTFTVEPPAQPKQVVQKKAPPPSAPIVTVAPKTEKEPPKVVKTEKSPPLKKEEPKSTKAKPAVTVSHGAAKKSGENQKLLAMMQTSLSKIETASSSKKGIKKPSSSPSEEVSYREELVTLLKLCLRLPETGEVKLKVMIDRAGNFKSMEVLEAGSKKNRAYVETVLPALALPPFGKAFQKEKEHTFSLTLQSSD